MICKMKKLLVFLVSVLTMALLLTGCGGDTEKKDAAAGGEQQVLNLFSWADNFDPEVIAEFEKQYNCKVNYDVFANNEELLAKIQAGGAQYDVIQPSDYMVATMLKLDLLEKMIDSGFEEGTTLKLANSIMLTGNQWQEPAAVDMALIDQYSGTCQFLKLGAACTYIKRGNWVECIKSTSLPMGVFQEVDMETITKKLYDGDFVIMVSDGIVDALDEPDKEEAMGRIIMDIKTSNSKQMAMEILTRALARSKGVPEDDMTVICTGILEKI